MNNRIKAGVVAGLMVVFIVLINLRTQYQDVSVSEVIRLMDLEASGKLADMEELGAERLREDFGLSVNDYESLVYYGKQSIMENDTLLIVHLNNKADAEAITNAITQKNEKLKELFSAYAIDQYQLLNESILKQLGNYIIYIVSPEANDIYDDFSKAITK